MQRPPSRVRRRRNPPAFARLSRALASAPARWADGRGDLPGGARRARRSGLPAPAWARCRHGRVAPPLPRDRARAFADPWSGTRPSSRCRGDDKNSAPGGRAIGVGTRPRLKLSTRSVGDLVAALARRARSSPLKRVVPVGQARRANVTRRPPKRLCATCLDKKGHLIDGQCGRMQNIGDTPASRGNAARAIRTRLEALSD
jgi:hypothetical protein